MDPSRGHYQGSVYDDEPPAYYGESLYEPSIAPSQHTDPTASMRLLPTAHEHDEDMDSSDLGTNAARFRMGQASATRRAYVHNHKRHPGIYLPRKEPKPNAVESNPAMEPISVRLGKLRAQNVNVEQAPKIAPPRSALLLTAPPKGKAAAAAAAAKDSPPPVARIPPPPYQIARKPVVPLRRPRSLDLTLLDKLANDESTSANPSPTRVSPTRLATFRPRQNSTAQVPYSPSRPGSSMGNAPSIPPPAMSTDSPQYASRPGSPTRPWTPSRSSIRHGASSSVSGINYEPADINGSPRPGTPSSQYGGSPRRPLPPAPLFSVPSSTVSGVSGETSIDIGETRSSEDPFGAGAETIDHRPSYDSFRSESTMVTDEKDGMEKIDLDDETIEDTEMLVDPHMHYGPAPEGKQSRRGVRPAQMSKKEVHLINGELVLECKIPTILHSFLPRRDEKEFTHMRYTAVTCDPDEFVERGYKLRQNIPSTMRETELLICVTMYNENEVLFTRTMHGIMRNISHFCSRTKSRTWGKDGWKKIVVCIISDGRSKVHKRTLDALAAMGVYQAGIAKNIVNKKEVNAHVYEYTTQVSLDADMKFKGAEKGIVPCQVIFCLKEQNQKKLNSHRWLFNAFGRSLDPNVCILLDVGTQPAPTALYHLWKAFDQDSNVAGAAGEIIAGKGKNYMGLLNPLVASQNFEYKMSNILDKPLESVFGYITVLPGALSAYRYYALQNGPDGHGPLSQYFKGETLQGKDADIFTANMYLAEDRILCWELVAKKGERWVLKFVKSAVGETDVPGKLSLLFYFKVMC